MSKIAIFQHIYQYGDWVDIYTDQVKKLQESGLFDAADYMFLGVNGNQSLPFEFKKTNKVFFDSKNQNKSEYITLKALYDFSALNRDTRILYLHTKGVRWSVNPNNKDEKVITGEGHYTVKDIFESTQKWRKYLEYFLVHNWKKCNELLGAYDTVGAQWNINSNVENIVYDIPHYSGNMWWANSNYIRKLDPNFLANMLIGMYACELWIGTENPNYYNFHTINRNLYLFPPIESEYEGLIL